MHQSGTRVSSVKSWSLSTLLTKQQHEKTSVVLLQASGKFAAAAVRLHSARRFN
jgi:hypothetical protein